MSAEKTPGGRIPGAEKNHSGGGNSSISDSTPTRHSVTTRQGDRADQERHGCADCNSQVLIDAENGVAFTRHSDGCPHAVRLLRENGGRGDELVITGSVWWAAR